MKVSYDGDWYDVDTQEDELRAAIKRRVSRRVHTMYPRDLPGALTEQLAASTMIALKLGATAALHHAYEAAVDHQIVDVYAHVLNKLVGLNYLPPERVITEENASAESKEG